MDIIERLISFQNQGEKAFQQKKTFGNLLWNIAAIAVFMASTFFATLSMPIRLFLKLFRGSKSKAVILNASSENLGKILREENLVLIDFWAEWCGPCVMMNSTLQKFAKNTNKIRIVKVNADLNPKILKDYKIRGIPHFLMIKNGEEAKRFAGPMTLSDLEKFCFE